MSSPRLPAETLDHIIDFLHDATPTLRNCCLVSKSWIPRTRKYIFADITFHTEKDLESWKETFPDPSTSPANYTQTLFVNCAYSVTLMDAEAGGWIRGFTRVVHLELGGLGRPPRGLGVSLAPFHGLSPAIKSLRVVFAFVISPRILNLIFSLPLLEDLALITYGAQTGGGGGFPIPVTKPSNPPAFTGSLELSRAGITAVARGLLSLPSGIHSRNLALTWSREEELSLVMELLEGCSHTLESLDITCNSSGPSLLHLL